MNNKVISFYRYSDLKIMSLGPVPDFLAKKNHHPRDDHISFEEGPHIYTVLGERGTYTSVTTWNHTHFEKFDKELALQKVLNNPKRFNNPNYKYYNMTEEEIREMWSSNDAAEAGTRMHYNIECYYNYMDVEHDGSPEFNYFMNFEKDHENELTPYRTEWMIYHEDLKLSGSIDMVFQNKKGELEIYDWKRSKSIEYDFDKPLYAKYAITPCISSLPDKNFWHYSLQLNVYKYILETKYDKKITKMCLVCLHPDNASKTYELHQVDDLKKEIADLMELRAQQVEEEKSKTI